MMKNEVKGPFIRGKEEFPKTSVKEVQQISMKKYSDECVSSFLNLPFAEDSM